MRPAGILGVARWSAPLDNRIVGPFFVFSIFVLFFAVANETRNLRVALWSWLPEKVINYPLLFFVFLYYVFLYLVVLHFYICILYSS